MAVNLLTSYAKELDTALTADSFTKAHAKAEVDILNVKAGIIEVLTPITAELVDYDSTSATDRYGGIKEMQDSKQTYIIMNDKAFKLGLDKGNDLAQGGLKEAGKMLRLQIKEQVTPANDKVYFAKLAAATAGTGQEVVHVDGQAYDKTLDAGVYLDEALAPADDRTLFVSSHFYKFIKKDIVTNVQAPKTNDEIIQKGFVGVLDDFNVVKVPSSYLPANYYAFAVWDGAIANAPLISEARVVKDSEMVSGGLLLGRSKFDTFVLEAKKKAVAAIKKS